MVEDGGLFSDVEGGELEVGAVGEHGEEPEVGEVVFEDVLLLCY